MEDQNSIDSAISTVERQIEQHQNAARKLLWYVIIFASMILVAGTAIFMVQELKQDRLLSSAAYFVNVTSKAIERPTDSSDQKNSIAEITDKVPINESEKVEPLKAAFTKFLNESKGNASVLFAFMGIFCVVFGVLMAIYRFHLF